MKQLQRRREIEEWQKVEEWSIESQRLKGGFAVRLRSPGHAGRQWDTAMVRQKVDLPLPAGPMTSWACFPMALTA